MERIFFSYLPVEFFRKKKKLTSSKIDTIDANKPNVTPERNTSVQPIKPMFQIFKIMRTIKAILKKAIKNPISFFIRSKMVD